MFLIASAQTETLPHYQATAKCLDYPLYCPATSTSLRNSLCISVFWGLELAPRHSSKYRNNNNNSNNNNNIFIFAKSGPSGPVPKSMSRSLSVHQSINSGNHEYAISLVLINKFQLLFVKMLPHPSLTNKTSPG